MENFEISTFWLEARHSASELHVRKIGRRGRSRTTYPKINWFTANRSPLMHHDDNC